MSFQFLIDKAKAALGIGTTPKPPVVTPAPTPSPGPTPPGPSIPAPPTGTVITLMQRSRPGGWVSVKSWPVGRPPLYGSNPVNALTLASSGIWYEAIFTVLEGELTITNFATGGFHKPSMTLKKKNGLFLTTVKKGDVIQTGGELRAYFILGDVSNVGASGWKQANYEVWSKEMGRLVHLSAQVQSGI